MNYWLLTLTLINVLLLAYIGFSHLAKTRTKMEDQRLTKGLQLLQNKISILQDLSDKTDEQVRTWVHLIEQKATSVQSQLIKSDEKIAQIEQALSKALDVSKIFYEQVPAAEMAERQKTSKYVQAAKLANQGFTTDQIAQKVDLSIAEIDMITKMNREQLQFAEESLPAWVDAAKSDNADERDQELADFTMQMQQMKTVSQSASSKAFDLPKPDLSSMNQIKQQFTDSIAQNSTQIPQTFIDEKKPAVETKTDDGKVIRPFEFRKIVK